MLPGNMSSWCKYGLTLGDIPQGTVITSRQPSKQMVEQWILDSTYSQNQFWSPKAYRCHRLRTPELKETLYCVELKQSLGTNNHFTALWSRITRVSRCSQKERLTGTTTGFYEPDVLHATEPIVSKHYRKTQWLGRLLLYRHGIQCCSVMK